MKKFYLFVLTTFSSILGAYAQLTPPDSIVVELTGPSTSAYQLPAKMVIKTFGPATSTFTGSNNKPETGSPFYSQSVDAGATFFQITGQPAGFPPRKSSSSPQPNRTGGSSFLAIKDSSGFKKYWMNISVGAYLNTGTTVSNWEYHFRYFYNSKTGAETATLGSVPNSGEYIPGAVEFLVSLGNQKCKPFTGVIKDYLASYTSASIVNDPLEKATITLKDGTTALKTITTGSDGAYSFSTDSLSKDKLYNLEVTYQADTVPLTVKMDNIKVCNASPAIVVPSREMKLVLGKLDALKDLKIDASVFGSTISDAIPITNYDLSIIKQEIGQWREIDKEYDKVLETMNRTYLSLYLLDEYFRGSNQFSGKFIQLLMDVGEGVYGMLTASKSVDDLVEGELKKINEELAKPTINTDILALKRNVIALNIAQTLTTKLAKSILDGFQQGIVQAALAKFGDSPEDKVAKACILALSNALEKQLYGGSFGTDFIKTVILNAGTTLLVDQYYIGGTQKFVDVISPKISSHTYDASFAGVVPTIKAQLAATANNNEAALTAAQSFEDAAGQFSTVATWTENISKLLAVTVIGAPVAGPLYTISKAVNGFSVVSNAGALYNYGQRYFAHKSELELGLARTFSPSATGLLRVDNGEVSARLEATPIDGTAYQDSLKKYRDNIDNYTLVREAQIIDNIGTLETAMTTKIDAGISAYFAALSATGDTNLLKVYDEVVTNYGDFNTKSTVVTLQMLAHLLDSNNTEITASLVKEIDTLVGLNKTLLKSLGKADSLLALVTTPFQLVKISDVIAPDTIWHDSNFEVTVKYKNYGNFKTGAFAIQLTPSADLLISNDSIVVPALQAEQEASIKVQLSTSDITKNPSFLVAFNKVNSVPETVTLPLYSTIIKRGDVVNSIEDITVSSSTTIRVFPNPANEELFVVSNTSLGQGKISVYDTKGTLQLSQSASGTTTQLSTGSLSSGLYILTVQDVSGQIVKREKVVITNAK